MIEIGNMRVQESWTQYGVQIAPDVIVDYDDLAEAEQTARVFGVPVLNRHGYLTEWRVRECQS